MMCIYMSWYVTLDKENNAASLMDFYDGMIPI